MISGNYTVFEEKGRTQNGKGGIDRIYRITSGLTRLKKIKKTVNPGQILSILSIALAQMLIVIRGIRVGDLHLQGKPAAAGSFDLHRAAEKRDAFADAHQSEVFVRGQAGQIEGFG